MSAIRSRKEPVQEERIEATSSAEAGFRERERRNKGKIWWSLHLFAFVGALYLSPATRLDWRTAWLCVISWQLASFGVTIGYHRLWSHRAFTAATPLRIVLAWMGSMGFQGSIKWWVLRHRLHHRFTDSPAHDPYAATNGLFYSHCGWIFRKPVYPRMKLIERADLEADPVVRFQHKYYVPIALFSGLLLPFLIARYGWGDGLGGLVWGGAVARLLIWHTTFCINSLAHWTGLQPYTEEVTAKGNYLLALLTSGEGNHNFHHAFPKDFRNGPHPADWDPTKWIIYLLHIYTPLIPSIARTPESAIKSARARIHLAEAERLTSSIPHAEKVRAKEDLPVWSAREVRKRHGEWVLLDAEGRKRRRVLLLLEGCVVDVGGYLDDHPGGQQLLLSHSVSPLSSNRDFEDSGYSSSSSSLHQQPMSPALRPPIPSLRLAGSLPRASGALDSPGSSISSADSESNGSASDGDADGEGDASAIGVQLKDATRAFFGGMNNHSGAARERMRCLRVARLEA